MQTIQKGLRGYTSLKVQKEHLYIGLPRYDSKQHVLSTGMNDTPANRKKAMRLQQVIDNDIERNNLDLSLDRYRQQIKIKKIPQNIEPIALGHEPIALKTTISDLYSRYTDSRKPTTSPSTHKSAYATNLSKLTQCPIQDVSRGLDVSQWLLSRYTPNSSLRTLVQLNAAVKWGIGVGLLPDDMKNPYPSVMKSLSSKKQKKKDIEYYSLEERNRIINAAYGNSTYLPYAQLVELLFLTGLRWSEAIALHLGDWDGKHLTVSKAVVEGLSGQTLKQGLKTEDKRVIPVVPRAALLLDRICGNKEYMDACQIMFTSPKSGGYLSLRNYTSRYFTPLLEMIASEVPSFPVYTLYSARRTFISLALKSGYGVEDVARLAGNSPEIIYSNYAGQTKNLTLKDFS